MKKVMIVFSLLWIFSAGVHAQNTLDGIVAVVGDEIVLKSELIQTTQIMAAQMGVQPNVREKEFERLKKEVLNNLVNEKVLLAKAKEDTVTVDDQKVEAALDSRIEDLTRQLGSKEKLEAYFGSPVKKIKRDYREDIRKQLVIQTLQQEKFGSIQVSRKEVETFFETMKDSLPQKKPMVRMRHLLLSVRPNEEAKAQALSRIREIQEQLRNGASFEETAKSLSEDPGTSSRGGDLGFVERGTLFQSFEEAAFLLEPEQISDVIETPIGFHLIQMVEKRGDKIHVRHILIRLAATDNDEDVVRQKILGLRQRVVDGEDFGALVKQFSDDESSKENDGDLGWLPVEDLQIEEFKASIDTLDIGEISQPFKTQFGYHLVKMENRRGAHTYSLEEDWEEIRWQTLNRKRQSLLLKWIEELKKNTYIEIKNDMI
jgi:peptidyl-prolyl cis-trans isomerase SurA